MNKNVVSLLLLVFFLFSCSYKLTNSLAKVSEFDCLLLFDDHLTTQAEEWKTYLSSTGVSTEIVKSSEIFDSKQKDDLQKSIKLREYLQESFNDKKGKYVFMIGTSFPKMKFYPFGARNQRSGVSYIYSDAFFSDLTTNFDRDGDKYYGEVLDDKIILKPEIMIGRLRTSDPIIVVDYLERVREFKNKEPNPRIVFSSGLSLSSNSESTCCDTPIMDYSKIGENLFSKIDNTYEIEKIYEAKGIQSSEYVYSSDTCLDSTSLVNSINTSSPSIAYLNLYGDSTSLKQIRWLKDDNKNSFADPSEISVDEMFCKAQIVQLSSPSTAFFSPIAPSLSQESESNLAQDLLTKTGILFAGYSTNPALIDPNNEYFGDIINKWVQSYSTHNEIGDSLQNTMNQFIDDMKNKNTNQLESITSLLYSLSYDGFPLLKIKEFKNKPTPGSRATPVFVNQPLAPAIIKVSESNNKVIEFDPEEFCKANRGNGFCCTKDGGIVVASSYSDTYGRDTFCVTKYRSSGAKEWEFVPIQKSENQRQETRVGGAFDVIERKDLGGYLAVGYLEQESPDSKDDDLAIIVLDDTGMELYRYKYGSSSGKCRGSCEDRGLNIAPLKNGDFIVTGYQVWDGIQSSLYVAYVYQTGAIKSNCNRTIVINDLDGNPYKGPQPHTIIKQLDDSHLLMYVTEYKTMIITNLEFEEVYLKMFFDMDQFGTPDMVYLDPSKSYIPPELKGKMLFCYNNSLYSLEASGEQKTETKTKILLTYPTCCQLLTVYSQSDGIYMLCLDDQSKNFYLIKYDYSLKFLWKIDLTKVLKKQGYEPFYVSYILKNFKLDLSIDDESLKLDQILAKKLKTNKKVFINIEFELPYELRKPKLQIAKRDFISLGIIREGFKNKYNYRISNLGNEGLDCKIEADKPDITLMESTKKLSKFENTNFSFEVDAEKFKPGKYQREVLIKNVKDSKDVVSLKFTFEVMEIDPELSITPGSIDFGQLHKGEKSERDVSFSNAGGGILDIKLASEVPWLSMDQSKFSLGKMESKQVKFTVTFQNELEGINEGKIKVSSSLGESLIGFKVDFVQPKPKLSIDANSEKFKDGQFDFWVIDKTQIVQGSFFVNNSGQGSLTGKVMNKDTLIKIESEADFTLQENESVEIKFLIDPTTLKPDYYESGIVIESNDKKLILGVTWIVKPSLPVITPISVLVESILVDGILDKSILINEIECKQSMLVTTISSWIVLSKEQIDINKDTDYAFSIQTKGLSTGKHQGEILFRFEFNPKEHGAVKVGEIKIPVEINVVSKTSDQLIIELWIGKNTAMINHVSKRIDETNALVVPLIVKNTTMVPLRFTGEAFGAKVEWETKEQKITILMEKKKLTIILFVNEKRAMVDGNAIVLAVPPQIINGRVSVPLRFIGEALGAKIDWVAKEQKITITFLNS